jgi:hypothetical protein
MPNHCNNTLTLEGSPYDIREFARNHYRVPENWDGIPEHRDSGKTLLDFSYAVPYPPMNQRRGDDFSSGWYDWHIEQWGTKWNAYDVQPLTFPEVIEQVEHTGQLTYTFDTAWGPPHEWIEKAAAKNSHLTFTLTYEEMGMAFCGVLKFEDGKLSTDAHISDYTELLNEEERALILDEDNEEDGFEILREKIEEFFTENT